MAEEAGRLFDPRRFDLVIPVPLHPKRERGRGFNQARLLAKEFGAGCGLPVSHSLLWRVRPTEVQSGGRKEREHNVKGAFVAPRPDLVKNMKLLLIDDVLTTGATVSECTKVLLAAGAAEVSVYTLSRVQ
jgi:ComF family protein